MKKRKVLKIALLVIIIVTLIGVGVMKYINSNLEQVAASEIIDINLNDSDDGKYSGSFKAFPVSAKVNVTIKNHKITEIELFEHINGQGASAEVITEKVLDAQSLDIDLVAGATFSSKVILKAIENALISNSK